MKFDTCLVWELLLLPSNAQTAPNLPSLKGNRWPQEQWVISTVWIRAIYGLTSMNSNEHLNKQGSDSQDQNFRLRNGTTIHSRNRSRISTSILWNGDLISTLIPIPIQKAKKGHEIFLKNGMSFGSNSSGFSCHFSGGNFGLVNQTPEAQLLVPVRFVPHSHRECQTSMDLTFAKSLNFYHKSLWKGTKRLTKMNWFSNEHYTTISGWPKAKFSENSQNHETNWD